MPLAKKPSNYQDWIHWLEQRAPMPEKGPSIEPISLALKSSGLLSTIPAKRVIHIAGTNGKGTTAKTLQKLLQQQNLKVGLYTSPHLVDTCERIAINSDLITQNDFVDLLEKHYNTILQFELSHFETLTLLTVDYFFTKNKVDWAIFEIGLGGTWDATNAIPHDTSIITTLGLDHQHILGETIEEIADNKFGIIQKQNHVFHLAFSKETLIQNFHKIVDQQRAVAHLVPPPNFSVEKQSHGLPKYYLNTPWGRALLSLPGARAAENMWLALNVFIHLGYSPEEGIATLSKIEWPARMTPIEINTACPIFLSGDHNIQGILSLTEILQQAQYKKLFVVLGLSKNRTHDGFITALQKLPRVTITLSRPSFRGVDPENKDFLFFENPIVAINHCLSTANSDDLIVVTGSLYLCGDVMRHQSEIPTNKNRHAPSAD